MPIAYHLMIHPQNSDVVKIISHPQALAQTYHLRNDNYPEISSQGFYSTAASAKLNIQSVFRFNIEKFSLSYKCALIENVF